MYIHSLHSALKESEVGGKAASLSTILKIGVKVPDGVALDKEVLNYFREFNSMPDGLITELTHRISELISTKLIVRSSAIGEDSDSHSFAGQLDSFVVDNSIIEVEKAIYTCWDGLNNDRVKAYGEHSGKVLDQMGVVIQEFLEADYAGVTFTQSPKDKDAAYTEYVNGAGEQLVSGRVTPKNITTKQTDSVNQKLPFNIDKLLKESFLLKESYDCHLDIEWVAIQDEIYFVQARPITVHVKNEVFWSNTNLNENYPDPISPLLYSIARDSYYHYFKNISKLLQINDETLRGLEYDFSNTVGIWGNRIYYNMTSIHNVMSSSPLKAYFKAAFNQFVGYQDKDVASSSSSKRTSLAKVVSRMIRLNFRLESHVRQIEWKVSSFSASVDKSSSDVDTSKLFYEFLDLRFNQWYHASLADLFSMIHYKLLGKMTMKFYGDKSIGVHNKLIQAIPGLISSEPLNDTWDLVAHIDQIDGARAFFLSNSSENVWSKLKSDPNWESIKQITDDYLSKWGFRCSGELMFFKRNYSEEPERFIELLQSYMRNSAVNPREVIALKDKERRKTMRAFALKILKRRHIFLPLSLFEIGKLYLLARLCKNAISSRERVRYKQAEMYYKFKVVVGKIGAVATRDGRLSEESDIFYMNYKEIGELLSSSGMEATGLKDQLCRSRMAFDEESEKIFPSNFSTNFGERPDRIHSKVEMVEGATEFNGLAASGGRIKARVKVLESVLEGEKLEKGDILVTKQTDPGWAMVFPIIGGLIVERGGALSHGAIVAREFGIPAVIGIENITEILKDNDLVVLDGDLGKIQIIEE